MYTNMSSLGLIKATLRNLQLSANNHTPCIPASPLTKQATTISPHYHLINLQSQPPSSTSHQTKIIKMNLSLTPRTQHGVLVWTPTTLLLHLLWGWQFALSCALQAYLFFTLALSGLLTDTPTFLTYIYIFFFLNILLILAIIAEICLYANALLTPNIYLSTQIGKLVYVGVFFAWIVWEDLLGVLSPHYMLWRFILTCFVFW